MTVRGRTSSCSCLADHGRRPGCHEEFCNTLKPCTEPPYSVGQESANDLNANMAYPSLDKRIAETYAKRSTATTQRTLYDSYLRAFRWATDRVGDHGVVAFVSNGGWIDGNTADGIRLALASEYNQIYVYNLRGNQRTAGELSRREGGKVFGSGSRNTVAILIGVRNPAHTGPCEIFYRDIGDYLTRERKLEIVAGGDLESVEWQPITPNEHGDWVQQRSDDFGTWPVLGDKKPAAGVIKVFAVHSLGLNTSRDLWIYNSSEKRLRRSIQEFVDHYNNEVDNFSAYCSKRGLNSASETDADAYLGGHPAATAADYLKWSSSLKQQLARRKKTTVEEAFQPSVYRPFFAQHAYFGPMLIHRRGTMDRIFPTPQHRNIGMYVVGFGSAVPFSPLMVHRLPDLHLTGAGSGGQFFPRWTYERVAATCPGEVDEYGYRRIDNITDDILAAYCEAIGEQVTKDDIFFYVYGLLHDPDYRNRYAADLKKMLPHIPTPGSRGRFEQLAAAGRALTDLHIGYETVEPYPVDVQLKPGTDPEDRETWRVSKLKWAKKKDPETGKNVDDVTTLIYNPKVTVAGIPEAADRYMLGSRSALAWIIDRYQVKTDTASGIVNDPNDWCDEHDDPRYIVDLIAKVTTVSVETMMIVDSLADSAE